MQRDLGADQPLAVPATPREAHPRSPYQRLVAPVVRGLEAEIEVRGDALAQDMRLRHLAHLAGDHESVAAFEFRMRETYGELLPRLVVRGLVNLVPHLGALLVLYHLLPVVTLPGAGPVSTVSAYIAVGLTTLVLRALLGARARRSAAVVPPLPSQNA